jgi:hypothetical protein
MLEHSLPIRHELHWQELSLLQLPLYSKEVQRNHKTCSGLNRKEICCLTKKYPQRMKIRLHLAPICTGPGSKFALSDQSKISILMEVHQQTEPSALLGSCSTSDTTKIQVTLVMDIQ